MPKLSTQRNRRTITFDKDSFVGGFAPDFGSSRSQALEGKNNEYTYGNGISFWRSGFYGHIAPGETYVKVDDAGSIVNSPLVNMRVASTARSYALLSNGRIIRTDTTGGSVDQAVYMDTANTSGEDIITIKASTGTEYVIWSYNGTVGAADIGIVGLDLSTGLNATWFTTTLAGGALTNGAGTIPHKMMYRTIFKDIFITNGQYIATITLGAGTAGTGNAQALNLGIGFVAQSLCQYGNYIAIVGNQAASNNTLGYTGNTCRLWLWDGTSPDINFAYDIPDNYVAKVINDNGTLKVFTQGKNNTTKLLRFNGSGFSTINEFNSTLIGDTPKHDAVEIYQDMVHWASGTNLYNEGLHCRQVLTKTGGTTATSCQMVKNLYGNTLHIGVTLPASVYEIWKSTESGYTTSSSAKLISRKIPIPHHSQITGVTVYFSQFINDSRTKVIIDFFTPNTGITPGTGIFSYIIDGANFDASTTQVYIPFFHPDMDYLILGLMFNHASITAGLAAIIERIEVHIEVTDKNY